MTARRVRHGPSAYGEAPSEGAVLEAEIGVYSPSRHDPIVRAASAVVGGPAGRRLASATGFWRAVPVLMMLGGIVLSLGVVQKQHCRAQGWSSPDQFWHACYSDTPVLFASSSLGTGARPSLMDALGKGGLGQPPLTGAVMWVTSSFLSGRDAGAMRNYFDLSAILLALIFVIGIAAAALTLGRHSWDAGHLALSPVLITAGLISYELLAVTLVAVALLVLARGRPVLGGIVMGLAVASAPQVAVIAGVVLVLSIRYLRNVTGVAFAGSTLGSWLILRILLLPGFAGGLGSAWSQWRHAVPGYGSFWLVPQLLGASEPQPASSWVGKVIQDLIGWIFDAGSLSGTTTAILDLLVLVVLVGVVLRFTVGADSASDREAFTNDDGRVEPALMGRFVTDRVAPLSLAVLAVALITEKSLPVQASLLLLPLMALSGLRWRDHLIWAATELVYFVGIWLYIGGETRANRGLPASFYLILVIARLIGIAWVGLGGIRIFRTPPDQPTLDGPDWLGDVDGQQISSPANDAGSLLSDRGAGSSHFAG
jgi:hypothetical protein